MNNKNLWWLLSRISCKGLWAFYCLRLKAKMIKSFMFKKYWGKIFTHAGVINLIKILAIGQGNAPKKLLLFANSPMSNCFITFCMKRFKNRVWLTIFVVVVFHPIISFIKYPLFLACSSSSSPYFTCSLLFTFSQFTFI